MEKIITINNQKYEILENYREAIDEEVLASLITDYFTPFTYIVGDWAYSKLRLKGFFDKDDPNCNKYNNICNISAYLKNNCAYGCKWFEIKKIKD
jgi:uncharacterized protein YutD